MLGSFRTSGSKVVFWALLVAIVIGLGGFGIGVGVSGGGNAIATVGDQTVTSQEYVRTLQQELRAITQQTGRTMPMAEARQYGVDRIVLGRLINDAALDEEAERLGLSVGDDVVREQVTSAAAFRGTDGKFDRQTYTYALERAGLQPAEFEALLRGEATRELIAGSVQAPVAMPEVAALTILDFLGEKRGFDWVTLDASLLPSPVPAPTEADLEAQHDTHKDLYTRPETRRITYAAVTPDALAATIEIPEDELRAAYDAALSTYQTPERRVADRIGFSTMADAEAAKARLDAGSVTFEALATERGLQPGDIDQGFLTADKLDGAVRDVVFGAAGPGIVGPVETPLGPSLYRINAILAAQTTPFETAREEIARQKAREAAEKMISDDTARVEDLLAGGATAEDIASETELELGTIEIADGTQGGLADDAAFRQAALGAEVGAETDLIALSNGGIATLRVDAIDPPAVIPLDQVRDKVAADWTTAKTAEALTTLAQGYADEVKGGLSFADLAARLSLPVQTSAPITRGDVADGAPAGLVADIFATAPDGTVIRADGPTVTLAQVTAVEPFDPASAGNAATLAQVRQQFDRQASDDVLALFTAALRDQAGVSLNQSLIESTLARFP